MHIYIGVIDLLNHYGIGNEIWGVRKVFRYGSKYKVRHLCEQTMQSNSTNYGCWRNKTDTRGARFALTESRRDERYRMKE